jgi:putative transposase
LVGRVLALAALNPRYGYRRITAPLRREGWRINKKRAHRVWRREGLKTVAEQRKRRRLGAAENACHRRRAERPRHVWSYDFVMDQTEDGRRLKMPPVVDEFTRECLTVEVERRFTAQDVVRTLDRLFKEHGAPEYIRSDNGPEFVATAVKQWLSASGVATLYIEPAGPWEDAYSESFNSRFRDGLLDRELFTSLVGAKALVADYASGYNHERPHSALQYATPAAFAASQMSNSTLTQLGT